MPIANIGLVGKIKSVAVINFVTYDKTLFLPQEYLNIIIGPNGTGKSTIVSAIVLGMGGNCKVLSRSSNIEDFIKNGKDEAKIEVKIYKDNNYGVLTLNRTFNKQGVQTFGIDGKKISQRDYLKRVSDFNIQIDNLCQFLPQDRVQDFAKMNPQEILINTQNSVCSKDILETFTKLTELQNTDKNSDKEYSSNILKLTEAQKRNEGIKAIIDTMREKDNLLAKVKVCQIKKAWLNYDTFADKCKLAEADLEASKQALNMKEKKLQPLQERFKNITNHTTELQERLKEETKRFEKNCQGLLTATESSEKLEDLLLKSKSEYQELLASVREKEKEIDTNQKYLAALLKDMDTAKQNEIPDVDLQINDCTEKVNKIKAATIGLMERRNNINQELDDSIKPQMVAHQRRIEAMENIREMRLKVLKHRFTDVYTATMWLKDNRDMFQGVIYDPVLLEINVKDKSNAKYIENIVSVKDLICFICENTEDVSRLKHELCVVKKLKINIAESKPSSSTYRPNKPIESLRQFGFQNYVLDLIEGPVPVLNQLCSLYNIHNVPVGNDYTHNNTNIIPNNIRLYFSTNHRISNTISKYSDNCSTMTSEISGKDLLGISVDQTELNNEKRSLEKVVRKSDSLKNTRVQIEGEIKNNEVSTNDINATKKELLNSKKAKEEIFVKANRCKEKIKHLTNSLVDTTREHAKFTQNTKSIVDKLVSLKSQMIDQIDGYQKLVINLILHKEKLSLFNRNNNDLINEKRTVEDEVRTAKSLYDRVVKILAKCETDKNLKKREAMELSRGKNPNDKNFPFKADYENMPSVIAELQQYMDQIQSRIDCMTGGQVNIEKEYNDRLKYIEELKVLVANNATDKTKVRNDIKKFHSVWFLEISKIVEIINTNFTKFMCSMGFAGEVQIIHKDEHDYAQYGIQIQVKYRSQEKLQALDRYIQSGGERAVAIAVYTLSLQHITNVPFRCVDEINQGMDQRNERKVFEMLVRETCQKGNSQYFFVTPKLLPNLTSNEKMSVHIVHNGKNIEHAHMFLKTQSL